MCVGLEEESSFFRGVNQRLCVSVSVWGDVCGDVSIGEQSVSMSLFEAIGVSISVFQFRGGAQ